ncbi:MAG: putative calcium-translocating P-type ATPase [Streblomastix strix]|uniref:Putative calcium-translocating P-type ATPase n=1 Tax=Streblomastix strix TaxID=222440 RepID=A0A5J4WMA0_9EUKA|nr:MAG: putative calcium-translocating P-type ATPase [Streblomastix strix]
MKISAIGYVGFVAAGFTLLLLIIFWIIPAAKDTARFKQGEYWMLLLDYFIIAITIIVMAVPEGLPLAVTIALAYSMKKMLKDNNLVRVLSACETMGGATTICSDKTGTLTQNKMKVVAGFFDGDFLEGLQQTRDREVKQTYDTQNPAGDEPQSVPMEQVQPAMHSDTRISAEFLALITEAISMNSSADLKVLEDGRVDYLGNVTECAMLLFAKEQGVSYKEVRLQNKIAQTFPFSSEKKRMSVIIEKGKDDKDFYHIYTKGASEIVSGLCSRMHQKGKIVQITPDLRQSIDSIILKMASKGLRTIAIAHNSLPKSAAKAKNQQKCSDNDADDQGIFGENPPQDDLILIGIVGIKDPLREEVPFAINDCHDAHIVVRMVTGDNIITAMHIAEECGIYDPAKGIAMEGPVFRALPPEDQLRVLPKLQVLARSSPIDKHTLVSGLQQLGHVVAVTGDGTNDAPALSKADVGFAMGITGTEVAKDAAAIIITDDNFASIVKAVMWGRNVYDSIRKFIQFQLTVNVAAIIIAVIGAIFAITPLRAVQMLWVNLIMDTLAALALATETPTKKLLQRSPYGKGDSIICPSMWRNIIASAIYEIIVLIILLFMWGPKADWSDPQNININTGCSLLTSRDEIVASELMFPNGLCRSYLFDSSTAVFSERHFSLIFNTFIFTQMFNWIASRKCYNELNFFDRIFESLMFVFIWIIVAVLQVVIMLVPGIRDAFTIIPISGQMWGVSLAFSIMILPYRFLISLLLKVPDPFHGEVSIQEDAGAPSGVYKMDTPPPEGCNLKLPPIDKANSAAPAPLPPHQPSFSILGDQALPTEKGPVVDADGKEVNDKYVRFRQAGKSAHTVMAWKRPLELGKSKIIEEKYLPKYGSNVWQQKNQQHRESMANLQPGGGVPKKSPDGRTSSPMGVSTTSQQQTTGQKLSETSGQIETPRAQAASEENETS